MIIKRYFTTIKKSLSKKPILPKQTSSSSSENASDVSIVIFDFIIKKICLKTSNHIYLLKSQFFVDFKTTTARGGRGGDGMVSFMHLKGNEFAGPDGGDGGNGGNVIFKACENVKSLNRLQSIYEAEHGEPGRSYHMRGKNGKDLLIRVPIGSSFKFVENNEICAHLKDKNAEFVACRGGDGGKGNAYYLSNDNRRPRQFEHGKPGQEFTFHAQLNIIADAAFVSLF
jgi:GTP-binding protein